jgi:hypothetical protein
MNRRDPQQVIVERLTAARTDVSDGPTPVGWRTQVSQGGFEARPTGISFLKERGIPGRQLHAVTFMTDQGRWMDWTLELVQDEDGNWQVEGGAGGDSSLRDRDPPTANLGCGGWPNRFYAGGRVLDTARHVERVQLIGSNGTTLEDTVDDGWVLFLTDQPVELPVQVQLYDGAGRMVNYHLLFGHGL